MGATCKTAMTLKSYLRALRLAFVSASVLPFIFGSLMSHSRFNLIRFLLGLLAVACVHLAANLINDWADSRSGADWQDGRYYNFFGGSKLIQEGLLSEHFYLRSALILFFISALCVFILALDLRRQETFMFFLVVLILSWAYSAKPLQLSYRRWGELVIFLLFGPVPVVGGYFIQTGVFPAKEPFLLSLPFGLLTTAILFVNEVPDFATDTAVKKSNWVGFLGPRRAFILYYLLIILAFSAVLLNLFLGYIGLFSLLAFLGAIPALQASRILRVSSLDREKLVEASRLTIVTQNIVSIILILGALI